MAALLQMMAALLASHAGAVARHAKRMALFGAALGVAALVAVIYFLIFLTHLLALIAGTTGALAVMTLLALFVCLLFLLALRREKRGLVAAHRRHLDEERLALRAAGIEAAEASKLSGSIAAISASLAAVIVLILRRLGPGEGPRAPGSPDGDVAREAPPAGNAAPEA